MRLICSGTIGISLTLEETLQAISDLGFREVDLLLVSGWAHIGLDEIAANYNAVARMVERLLGKYRLSVASVSAKYSVRLEDTGEEEVRQRQLELEAMLRFMADFGVGRASVQPTLTHDAAYLKQTYTAFEKEIVRQQEYAAEHGALLALEPHIRSAICTNAALRPLLQANPGLCITYDPSHLLCSGEEMGSTGYLFPHAAMVHLRDARKGELFVPGGQGKLDIPYVIRGLKQAGYDGPIAIEYLSEGRDKAVYEDLLAFAQDVQRSIDRC